MPGPKTPEDQPEVDAAALFGEQTEGSAAPSLADALAAAEPEERLHPVLSNEEVLAARAKARSNIEAQRRKAATTDLIKAEEERLAREEGLVPSLMQAVDEFEDVRGQGHSRILWRKREWGARLGCCECRAPAGSIAEPIFLKRQKRVTISPSMEV